MEIWKTDIKATYYTVGIQMHKKKMNAHLETDISSVCKSNANLWTDSSTNPYKDHMIWYRSWYWYISIENYTVDNKLNGGCGNIISSENIKDAPQSLQICQNQDRDKISREIDTIMDKDLWTANGCVILENEG